MNRTKKSCFLLLQSLLLPALFAGLADAVTGEPVLDQVKWGESAEQVAARLEAQEVSFTLLDRTDRQALSKALLRSRLLETLNRLGFKDTFLPEDQGPRACRFILFRRQGRAFVLLFEEKGGLYQVYVRIPVRVDRKDGGKSNRFDAKRLAPLKKELRKLEDAFGIKARKTDRHGNVFDYSGRRGGTFVALIYDPVEEELRTVFAMR